VAYIKPPEPPDHVVLIPGDDETPDYTWGDQRKLGAMLEEMEAENPAVAAARVRLDEALEKAGMLGTLPELICEFCWRPESKPHEIDCQDNNDPSLWVKREAGGYQYMDQRFRVIHTTSLPMTDDEALEYFGIVQLMFPAEPDDFEVKYIMRREIHGTEYKMMPWQFDKETWEVSPIERPGA